MDSKKITTNILLRIIAGTLFLAFVINPFFGFITVIFLIAGFLRYKKVYSDSSKNDTAVTDLIRKLEDFFSGISSSGSRAGKTMLNELQHADTTEDELGSHPEAARREQPGVFKLQSSYPAMGSLQFPSIKGLQKGRKYLQIALNASLQDARNIIRMLPRSESIIIEAGTPLIKISGAGAIEEIRRMAPYSYIVADLKTADLAEREAFMAYSAGANAAVCLGVAPIETIEGFIKACERYGMDPMVDMMNVENPLLVLKKLKNRPKAVVLHRGVDEAESRKDKPIPFYQIKQIKGNFDIMVAVAGGDSQKEIQSAVFNDADIVVVWKNFFQSSDDVGNLAENFLKDIKL